MGKKLVPVPNNSKSNSQNLPPDVQHRLETQFGQDFSQVRVYEDHQATVAVGALGARAFTVGNDICFSPGNYQPHSEPGLQLISHEIAHVIQQANPVNTAPNGTVLVETED